MLAEAFTDERVTAVIAHTLPERNASTASSRRPASGSMETLRRTTRSSGASRSPVRRAVRERRRDACAGAGGTCAERHAGAGGRVRGGVAGAYDGGDARPGPPLRPPARSSGTASGWRSALPGRQGRLLFAFLDAASRPAGAPRRARRGAVVRGGPAARRRRAAAARRSRGCAARWAPGRLEGRGELAIRFPARHLDRPRGGAGRRCARAAPLRRRRRARELGGGARGAGDRRARPAARASRRAGSSRSAPELDEQRIELLETRGAGRRAARRRRAARGRAGRPPGGRAGAVPRVRARWRCSRSCAGAETWPRRSSPTTSSGRSCATSSAPRRAGSCSRCTRRCCAPSPRRRRPRRRRARRVGGGCPTGSRRRWPPRGSGARRRSPACARRPPRRPRGGPGWSSSPARAASARRGWSPSWPPASTASTSSTAAATRRRSSRTARGSTCCGRRWSAWTTRSSRPPGPDAGRPRPAPARAPRAVARGRRRRPRGDPETERRLLFVAVTRLVGGSRGSEPLLLVLDDLHWADRSSLLLGRHLAREPRLGPVLLVGTFRDTELDPGHPLPELIADVERDRPVPRVRLGGMDEQRGRRAGRRRQAESGRRRPRDPRRDRRQPVLRQAARPPPRGRSRRGEAGCPAGRARRHRPARRPAARGRRSRAARGRADRPRLRVTTLLARVADVPEDELLDVLDAAVRGALLAEVPSTPGRYSFAHALLRSTMEAELSATRRALLHRRIGEAIEQRHRDRLDPWLDELARHFAAAGPAGGRPRRRLRRPRRRAGDGAARLRRGGAAARAGGGAAPRRTIRSTRPSSRGSSWRWRPRRRTPVAGRRRAPSFARAADGGARGRRGRRLRARRARPRRRHVGALRPEDAASIALLEEALERLPAGDSLLRAQVLARLAVHLLLRGRRARGARAGAPRTRRSRSPGGSATPTPSSRRSRPPSTPAGGPDARRDRLPIADELIELAEARGSAGRRGGGPPVASGRAARALPARRGRRAPRAVRRAGRGDAAVRSSWSIATRCARCAPCWKATSSAARTAAQAVIAWERARGGARPVAHAVPCAVPRRARCCRS